MDTQILKEMSLRAESKNDGVYSYKGNFYAVNNKRLKFIVDRIGNVFQMSHGFMVSLGRKGDRFEGRKFIKSNINN